MLRKTVFLAALLLGTPVWANTHGIYLGLGAGPEIANINQDSSVTFPGSLDVKNKVQLAANGGFVSLFGGYEWNLRNFYVATEANADFSSTMSYSSNDEFFNNSFASTKYKMYNSFGLSVLPGIYVANSTIFFGRLGYSAGSFRVVTSDVSLQNINTYLSGFRWGLGIKQDFSEHFAGRLEYSHVSYTTAYMNTSTGVFKNTSDYPQTSKVEFAVIYSFA